MNGMFCIFYVPGLFLVFAYDDLSYNKIATQSHTSLGTVYDASNAVDRNTATCMRTHVIGTGTNMAFRTVWWKVDLGGFYSIYTINIQFKNYDGLVERQRGRFAGFSLYVSNTDVSSDADIQASTLCYKDGPELPILNFTTVCTKRGRYVVFYNERLEGTNYPNGYELDNVYEELCEVIVQGCNNASLYSSTCDTPCPSNCKDSACHIQNGACSSCKHGWIGVHCNTSCGEGWYGMNCSQQCKGYCRERATCNHVTGQCDEGCADGWTGYMCDKECDDGTYGYNCVNNCSGHCLNDSPCNKQTGYCDRGCKPGYTNADCSKECPYGQFGLACSERCSGHCRNNESCDHISGVCQSGCQDGYVGIHCTNTCTIGYFGTNCSRVCSLTCKPDTCRHTDGGCTCIVGWTGEYCTKECVQSYGEYCRHPCSLQCYNNTCDKVNGRCLIGCKDGFYGQLCDRENELRNKNMSSFIMLTIGLSVSVLINMIFIVCGILLCRGIATNKENHSNSILACWKRPVYQDTVVKNHETSTYQELDLTENVYQNTTIR